MTDSILIYSGGRNFSLSMGKICWDNRETLWKDHSVLYPEEWCIRRTPRDYSHSAILAGIDPLSFRADVFAKLARASGKTIILNMPYCLRDYETTVKTIRKAFPKSELRLFLCLERQDLELEERVHLTLFSMRQRAENVVPQLSHRGLHYDLLLAETAAAFGKNNVTRVVNDQFSGQTERLHELFFRAAGLPSQAASAVAAKAAASPLAFPSMGVRDFILSHVSLAHVNYDWKVKAPWSFVVDSLLEKKYRSLLDKETRMQLWQTFNASNARAAAMLDQPFLFSEPGDEPAPEPAEPLTLDSAKRIAAALPKNFAQKVRDDFERLSPNALAHDQRICLKALREVTNRSSPSRHIVLPKPAKLSVVTLCYNHEQYIGECIESVLAQETTFPVQHIIADNASTDGTRDIILEYAKRHPHIVPIFHSLDVYCSNIVSLMYDMARTEYVAICEGDDYFTDPEKLQKQVDYLEANQDQALCFHPVRVVYEDAPERERIYPTEDILPGGVRCSYSLQDLIQGNFIQTNSVVYRWAFTKCFPFWFRTDIVPGDWYLHLLHAEKGKIGFINKIMSAYRRHASALYYLAEIDKVAHRRNVGLKELKMYQALDTHFKGKFKETLQDLANGVLVDLFEYSIKTGDDADFTQAVDMFPEFGLNFLKKLRL